MAVPAVINMQPWPSTNIVSVGYDPEKQELAVEFSHGAMWLYDGVNEREYASFEADPSARKGGYFDTRIKGGKSARRL